MLQEMTLRAFISQLSFLPLQILYEIKVIKYGLHCTAKGNDDISLYSVVPVDGLKVSLSELLSFSLDCDCLLLRITTNQSKALTA